MNSNLRCITLAAGTNAEPSLWQLMMQGLCTVTSEFLETVRITGNLSTNIHPSTRRLLATMDVAVARCSPRLKRVEIDMYGLLTQFGLLKSTLSERQKFWDAVFPNCCQRGVLYVFGLAVPPVEAMSQ